MRIFDFALVTAWESQLQQLASMAEPERWTYLHVPSERPLPVLDSYIRHTFLRVSSQEKVFVSDRFACFNTGLLTPSQEEIYGLFDIADKFDPKQALSKGNKKWYLKGWARAGDRSLIAFSELPTLATYWDNPGDLIFDPSLQVQLNVDHIIRDNLSRFPEEMGGKVDASGVPTDLGDAQDDEDAETGSPIESPESIVIPLALRNALDGAMKHSIRLAQRSYRMAVPQFHHGNIQLLLPLYLRTADRADLALTLERHGNWYRAATVLYPDWAYRHARLLARPNSEWLGGFRSDLTNG